MAEDHNQQNHLGITEGDTEVWREFLNCQIPQLYGMFMKRWPNPSLAEELVQKIELVDLISKAKQLMKPVNDTTIENEEK